MLGADAPDTEDAVQDSLIATLAYVRRKGGFSGRIQAFATTVVRNRCLDLLRHRRRYPNVAIDDVEEGRQATFMDPLDRMIADERGERLRRAWEKLDAPCRELLADIFHKTKSVKELQRDLGVNSVQVVYYRKGACLRRLLAILQNPDSSVEESERTDGTPSRRETEEWNG